MGKVRTTVTLDEEVLRAAKVCAAQTGRGDSELIEDALRRYLGFGLLERLWAKARLGDAEAMALADEAKHASRRWRA
jgi:metal-responsive CopG/Arc/MetJ family transcriptional regulator